jgi:hypothetical protein
MLKQDRQLEIIGILEKVREDVAQDKVDLDEKRKDQILKIISSINREQLVYFVEEENKIKGKLEECWKEIASHNIELVDPERLMAHKNDSVLEIAKLEKRQHSLEQAISERKNEIQGTLKTVSEIELLL